METPVAVIGNVDSRSPVQDIIAHPPPYEPIISTTTIERIRHGRAEPNIIPRRPIMIAIGLSFVGEFP